MKVALIFLALVPLVVEGQSSTIFSRLAGDDGRVDVGELEYYITLRTHQLHVAFALSDRDGANFAAEYIMQLSDKDDSGILNFIEFESAERAIDKAIELFKKADAHREGFLTRDEMRSALSDANLFNPFTWDILIFLYESRSAPLKSANVYQFMEMYARLKLEELKDPGRGDITPEKEYFDSLAGFDWQMDLDELTNWVHSKFRPLHDYFAADAILKVFDIDGDAYLNFDEFSAAASATEKAETLYSRYDEDGYMDSSEFLDALEEVGVKLSDDLLKPVFQLFSRTHENYRMEVGGFIEAYIRLTHAHEEFEENKKKSSDTLSLNLEEFYIFTLWS